MEKDMYWGGDDEELIDHFEIRTTMCGSCGQNYPILAGVNKLGGLAGDQSKNVYSDLCSEHLSEKHMSKILAAKSVQEGRAAPKWQGLTWSWKVEFKPQDCWVGVYWERGPKTLPPAMRFLHIWVCLIPWFPIHFYQGIKF